MHLLCNAMLFFHVLGLKMCFFRTIFTIPHPFKYSCNENYDFEFMLFSNFRDEFYFPPKVSWNSEYWKIMFKFYILLNMTKFSIFEIKGRLSRLSRNLKKHLSFVFTIQLFPFFLKSSTGIKTSSSRINIKFHPKNRRIFLGMFSSSQDRTQLPLI